MGRCPFLNVLKLTNLTFNLIATICPKAGAKPLPKNAKLPLPVYVFSSKKLFLKLPVNNYSAKGKCKAFCLTHRNLQIKTVSNKLFLIETIPLQHKSTSTNSAVWPLPYACAQPYHPSSFTLIGAHQHGICIVVAAIFDFITEEEWGELGRLRVGGGGGALNNQLSATKLYRHCP